MMKIAVVVNEMNIMGGTHKQVVRLCEYLKKNNVDFTLFTRDYDQRSTYAEVEQFHVVYLNSTKKDFDKYPYILKRIKEIITNKKELKSLSKLITSDYNIVNVHDNELLPIMSVAKKKGQIVVWQINDLPGEFRVGNSKDIPIQNSYLNNRAIRKINNISKKVDSITVNVTKNKDRVMTHMHRDAKVFYCGVDLNNDLNEHNGILNHQINLLSTGVFFPFRNYEVLIEVVRSLREKGLDVFLDIIGSTKRDSIYAQKILYLIEYYKLNDYIKIWGQVDNDIYNTL